MAKFYYIFLLLILLLSGCEKVINVDLNEANPVVVVEGNVDASKSFAEIKLSKTSNYFDQSESEMLSDADVRINIDDSESFLLPETGKGIYSFDKIPVKPGATYHLIVNADNNFYEGISVLQPKVEIDTLWYYFDNADSFFDKGYVINVFFDDPPDVDNYYRIKVFVNNKLKNKADDFVLFSDRFFDGQLVEIGLQNFDINPLDTVDIQLISLDEKTYDFYNTFVDLLYNNPGSAAPANPNTNLSNGALGYFSAWTSDKQRVIIGE